MLNTARRQAGQDGDDHPRGVRCSAPAPPHLLARELPGYGFEVKEVVKHANPTRDFNNIVLRMKSLNPDIVIPANYYNEYALLVRTMQQQKVMPKAIYSVLGGAASSYKFVKEFPDAANGIIDCNHWFNPKDKRAAELRKRVEAQGPVLHLRDLQHIQTHVTDKRIIAAITADVGKLID